MCIRDRSILIIDAAQLIEIARYSRDEEKFDLLEDYTAVDWPRREKRFDLVAQLYSFTHNARLRLKIPLRSDEQPATLVPIWPAANWLEREIFDLFGIVFRGHPNLKRILLPDEWQGHPLRKDYDILQQDTAWVRENLGIESGQEGLKVLTDTIHENAAQKTDTLFGADELVINMGPQLASSHGVLRVKLKLDGERVVGSECVIGYLHRGVEKIAENRTYQQFAPYVDRMDYVAAVSNGLGYCEAVEKLLVAEAPPRARVIRTILTELQRIASHLLWLGTHALDIGALTPLFYCMREREEVLKIFEKYCGARLTTHAFRIGGLQYEAYDNLEKDVERFCKDFESRIQQYSDLLTGNSIWIGRTRNVGLLNSADCIALGASGPVLRASGVKWDVRKAMPYAAYDRYKFEICLLYTSPSPRDLSTWRMPSSA